LKPFISRNAYLNMHLNMYLLFVDDSRTNFTSTDLIMDHGSHMVGFGSSFFDVTQPNPQS